jgi:hypothetical protein
MIKNAINTININALNWASCLFVSKSLSCEPIECTLMIKNKYLIGNSYKQTHLLYFNKSTHEQVFDSSNGDIYHRLQTLNMSFGSPFVNINDNLIAVGHGKILSNSNMFAYDETSILYNIQTNIVKILRILFNDKFKQHQSSLKYGCILGYNYFSYFIKYNDIAKTFFISDFFIPIDMSDEYHFSLIFTTGIFVVDETIYITSGEGDYYSSIIAYDKQSIIDSCTHDVLSEDFNIENVKFYFQFKFLDGHIENVCINNINDNQIDELIRKYCLQLTPTSILTSDSEITYYNKYLKYKNKYILFKKKMKKP